MGILPCGLVSIMSALSMAVDIHQLWHHNGLYNYWRYAVFILII